VKAGPWLPLQQTDAAMQALAILWLIVEGTE